MSAQYPRLHSYARNKSISVQELMMHEDLDDIFVLPLSTQAYEEMMDLQNHLVTLEYDDSAVDSWRMLWGPQYSSWRFYNHVFSGMASTPYFKVLWKSQCTPRVKFFAWLVLMDRLNTKTMLRRRHLNIQDDVLCVMCNQGAEEDIDHLFFTCPFVVQCWTSINFSWDVSLPLAERLMRANEVHALDFFVEASLIAAWELWKLRNDKIFQRRDPTPLDVQYLLFSKSSDVVALCIVDVCSCAIPPFNFGNAIAASKLDTSRVNLKIRSIPNSSASSFEIEISPKLSGTCTVFLYKR